MSAAAVIAIRRKQLIRAFREAGATDPDHAVTLDQLGQRRSWIFDQMAGHGVFLAREGGRYYMDERMAEEFLAVRRKRALIITAVLLLFFVAIWVLGWIKN